MPKISFKIRQLNVGIFPCVKTTSLNPDEHMAIKSPAKSQRKVVRKDQLHY